MGNLFDWHLRLLQHLAGLVEANAIQQATIGYPRGGQMPLERGRTSRHDTRQLIERRQVATNKPGRQQTVLPFGRWPHLLWSETPLVNV